ncbi:hypothetical protein QBC39DRAFT_326798 [Podospora conica]|nr:hypothetical protein QBC39DRAFT_326798 [Schizothecium conicum]
MASPQLLRCCRPSLSEDVSTAFAVPAARFQEQSFSWRARTREGFCCRKMKGRDEPGCRGLWMLGETYDPASVPMSPVTPRPSDHGTPLMVARQVGEATRASSTTGWRMADRTPLPWTLYIGYWRRVVVDERYQELAGAQLLLDRAGSYGLSRHALQDLICPSPRMLCKSKYVYTRNAGPFEPASKVTAIHHKGSGPTGPSLKTLGRTSCVPQRILCTATAVAAALTAPVPGARGVMQLAHAATRYRRTWTIPHHGMRSEHSRCALWIVVQGQKDPVCNTDACSIGVAGRY